MTFETERLSRRTMVAGGMSLGSLLLAGCSESASQPAAQRNTAMRAAAPSAKPGMLVHRDPSCGCCEAWAAVARRAGYAVTVRDDPDMASLKRRLGVPAELASCHTTEIGGVVIEGHVPMSDVARLLRERPQGVAGIAAPDMPLGSPGMEAPDGTRQPFDVIAFDRTGGASVFSRHEGDANANEETTA